MGFGDSKPPIIVILYYFVWITYLKYPSNRMLQLQLLILWGGGAAGELIIIVTFHFNWQKTCDKYLIIYLTGLLSPGLHIDQPPGYLKSLSALHSIQLLTVQLVIELETPLQPGVNTSQKQTVAISPKVEHLVLQLGGSISSGVPGGAAVQLSVSGIDSQVSFQQDQPGMNTNAAPKIHKPC